MQQVLPIQMQYGRQLSYTIPGTPVVGAGVLRYYNDTLYAWEILSVRAIVGVVASSGATTVDVNKNGTSIFASGADRPSIASGSTTNKSTTIGTTAVAPGEYLTIDADAIGTGVDTLVVLIAIR